AQPRRAAIRAGTAAEPARLRPTPCGPGGDGDPLRGRLRPEPSVRGWEQAGGARGRADVLATERLRPEGGAGREVPGDDGPGGGEALGGGVRGLGPRAPGSVAGPAVRLLSGSYLSPFQGSTHRAPTWPRGLRRLAIGFRP